MLKIIGALVMSLAAGIALGQDSSTGNETPAADQANDKTEAKTTAAAKEEEKVFKPPPGFQTKKRGNLVLYCRKETTVGTRFATERCYDEAQMHEYLLALEIQKRDVERIRSTCTTAATCSSQ